MNLSKIRVLMFLIAMAYIGNCAILAHLEPLGQNTKLVVLLYALVMGLAIAFRKLCEKAGKNFSNWLLLILILIPRALFWEIEISDDVYRYTWEGHIQNHGINPYLSPPNSQNLEHLQFKGYKSPNHPELTAIYPPFALLFMRQVSSQSLDYLSFKLCFTLFDLLTILLLALTLRARGKPLHDVIYYALNPVVLFAFAGHAHLDSMMLAFLAGGFLAFSFKSWRMMWILFALATMSKYLALILVPCFMNRQNFRYLGYYLATVVLCYFPFMDAGTAIFRTLIYFGTELQYNAFLFPVIKALLGGSSLLTLGLFFVLGCLICGWAVLICEDVLFTGSIVVTFFCLLAPTMHYWYLSFLAVFLVFYRSPALLLWCGLSGTWFLVLEGLHYRGSFEHQYLGLLIQYLPVYFLLFLQLREIGWKKPEFAALENQKDCELPSVGVVIPVLNEVDRLKSLLESMIKLNHAADEIVIVDGGSNDGTVEMARTLQNKTGEPIIVVESGRGRGNQVVLGIEYLKSEVVLVLHADKSLEGEIIQKVQLAMANPVYVGGAVGSRFEMQWGFQAIIYVLNVFRARIMGVSFGDQGQFFRRCLYLEQKWDLKMPLMEDVELSLCMYNTPGKIAYLGGGITSSVRRWQRRNRIKNSLEIIGFVFYYCFLRRFQGKVNTRMLYEKYYGDEP